MWSEILENGLEQGQAEGRPTAVREVFLEMIQSRFGLCTGSFQTRIEAIQDEGQLWQFARVVLKASSLADLETRSP